MKAYQTIKDWRYSKMYIFTEKTCKGGFWSCLEANEIIQGIAVLISLVIAIITYFTAKAAMKSANSAVSTTKIAEKQLIEINKQRIDSLRPEIYINNLKVKHTYHKGLGHGFFHEGRVYGEQETIDLKVYLDLNNIGNGPAKRIDIEWIFNLDNSIQKIKDKQVDSQFLKEFFPGEKIVIQEGSPIYLENDLKQEYPVFTVNNNSKILMPESYVWILSILIYFYNLGLFKDEFPCISCLLKYTDISGNKHSKEFKISPELYDNTTQIADGKIISYETEVYFKVLENRIYN